MAQYIVHSEPRKKKVATKKSANTLEAIEEQPEKVVTKKKIYRKATIKKKVGGYSGFDSLDVTPTAKKKATKKKSARRVWGT